jgi:hypothetical protein
VVGRDRALVPPRPRVGSGPAATRLYCDPGRPGYLRTRDGRWWDQDVIDGIRRQVDDSETDDVELADLIDRLHQVGTEMGLL